MNEIERKFLVTGDFSPDIIRSYKIAQGYLSTDPERTVRVRLKAEKGYITIKGASNASGLTRFEWEKEILPEDANALLELCKPGTIILKTRHEVVYAGKCFEIDTFCGENEGLVIAELELNSENELFELPEWIGKEVTGDPKYYNSFIAEHPYKKWAENL